MSKIVGRVEALSVLTSREDEYNRKIKAGHQEPELNQGLGTIGA